MRKHISYAALWLLAGVLLLSACELTTTTPTASGPRHTPTAFQPQGAQTIRPTRQPSPTPSPEQLGGPPKATDTLPADINPLTGLRVADPAILERRPVAVKISNYPRSNRPQWGLSLADLVYEYYHNNDLTRFYAIFYGQDAPLAGPIRSGRLFDSYLTDIYKNILVFASADFRVLERFKKEQPAWQTVGLLDGNPCPPRPVCRYLPETYNYLLADTSTLNAYSQARGGDDERPSLEGMTFSANAPAGGQTISRIHIYYSYSAYAYWEYDVDSGRYLRFQDTQETYTGGEGYAPLRDRLNRKQIAADNVVVLYIPHFHNFYQAGTDLVSVVEVVDMDFSGHDLAYAFRDGQAYQLEWVREEGKLLYLVDAEGQRFPFKPGTTWFQVMNEGSRSIPGENTWRFEFVFEPR